MWIVRNPFLRCLQTVRTIRPGDITSAGAQKGVFRTGIYNPYTERMQLFSPFSAS